MRRIRICEHVEGPGVYLIESPVELGGCDTSLAFGDYGRTVMILPTYALANFSADLTKIHAIAFTGLIARGISTITNATG